MQAAVRTEFGTPDVVRVDSVPMPELVPDGVLVRVRATSVNPSEWYGVHGRPWFGRIQAGVRRPRSQMLGTDFAGVVEAVGDDVTGVAPGDRVFGGRSGAWAEYLVVKKAVARIPDGVGFDDAAAVPVAAVTALQGLRDHGGLEPSQKVLINGASGGVGTYAVQIATALGAEVTAVCSTQSVEQARSLGADHVVDYTREDFTRGGDHFDLLLDIAGSRSWRDLTRVLAPAATVVLIGAPKGGRFLGPVSHFIAIKAGSVFSSREAVFFIAKLNRPDLEYLAGLMESGQMRSVIDRRYEGLDEIPEALRYLGEGHARGKIVVMH